MSRDVCQRVYAESGVKVPFHTASHHGETPSKIADFAKVNRYHVSMLPYFLEKLKSTPDGDGKSAGAFAGALWQPHGRFERAQPQTSAHPAGRPCQWQDQGKSARPLRRHDPMANVLLTVMRKVGMSVESIGDSTGEIAI